MPSEQETPEQASIKAPVTDPFAGAGQADILDLPIDDASVPPTHTVVPAEYLLRIESVEDRTVSKGGNPMVPIRLSIPGDPDSEPIFYYLMLPGPKDDAATARNKQRNVNAFAKCFGIALTTTTEFADVYLPASVGKEGWAFIDEEDGGQEYGVRNRIGRRKGRDAWIVPRT